MSVFRSFGNKQAPRNPDDLAAELARETCERFKELRAEAILAEKNIEEPKDWGPEAAECMTTIDALMRGRHRPVVLPIVLESFPELIGMVKVPKPSLIHRV